MGSTSAEPHLAAIPEAGSIFNLPGSARASPRSTSDSPARGTAPISPTSRLLRPTLSWQAKASWIAEPPTASSTPLTGAVSDRGSSQGQEPVAAVHTRDQATTPASLLSPSPPSAGWQSIHEPKQTSQGAAGDARNMTTSMAQAQQSSHTLVAQEKADQLSSLLQDELARRGNPSVTPWQQQRLQLRAVKRQSGSPAAQGGSPGHFHYADASMDTLQQQRAKLKPVQTSKLAALPASVQQGFAAAPVPPPNGTAHLRGVRPGNATLPAAGTGAVPAVRAPPAAPVGVDAAVRPQLGQTQPVTSPASQLRSKYGQLTDLLQSTALQRGISLSQVPIPPTQKSGKGQPKRVSLEEVRTSFRSFTASTAANSSKPAPLRRVSTGAITPAFLKEKDKQDKALLESLGVADAAADGSSDAAVAVDTAGPPIWASKQSNRAGLVDETPAVFTRGKGYARPTGNSFDIKSLETQDEISSSAEADMTAADTMAAAQASGSSGASQNGNSNAARGSNRGDVHDPNSYQHRGGAAVDLNAMTRSAATEVSPLQPSRGTPAKPLDPQMQTRHERTGDVHAAGVFVKDSLPPPQQVQQVLASTEIKKLQTTNIADDNGINSSSVIVDITLAQHSADKMKAADKTGQQSESAQNGPVHDLGRAPSRGFARYLCCFCCSTKE